MARTAKCRRVCAEPCARLFCPEGEASVTQTLTVEELEALRLCDLEELRQEEAAKRMAISRGTLQRMLHAARKKTACALTNGMRIAIEGGNYEVVPQGCGCEEGCRFCTHRKQGDVEK